jgi:hypothetical protein
MELNNAAALTMGEPYPNVLWKLKGVLLEVGTPLDDRVMMVLDNFYHFLTELEASSSAREYSHFASILDMAAVAGVALQNLMAERGSEDWIKRFLLGAISEGMMVMAARQYVKAWEEEMKANYRLAAWFLHGAFWQISAELQPDLAQRDRRILVDQLVSPILAGELNGSASAALIVRYYQLLLLAWLAPKMADEIETTRDGRGAI